MEYVALKDGLDALLLTDAAAGDFAVIGARGQGVSAEALAAKKQIYTYYDGGDLPKSSGFSTGQSTHDVDIKIELLVSAKASVDLEALNNPNATDQQRAAALAAMKPASFQADELLDTFISRVWNLVMDPVNAELGLGYDPDCWITRIDKSSPAPRGALVVISATLTMTATVQEIPAGETPVAGTGNESDVGLTADQSGETVDSAKQGVEVNES
jgi:hypothetical protein